MRSRESTTSWWSRAREARIGRGVVSQLDVQLERLLERLVALGDQVELSADDPGDLAVRQDGADALRKNLQRVERRGNVGPPAERDEPRVRRRSPHREFVAALIEQVRKLGRGEHAAAVVDAVTNQRKCAVNGEEKIPIRVSLGESEVGPVLDKGRLDLVVTEEGGIKVRIVCRLAGVRRSWSAFRGP